MAVGGAGLCIRQTPGWGDQIEMVESLRNGSQCIRKVRRRTRDSDRVDHVIGDGGDDTSGVALTRRRPNTLLVSTPSVQFE